MKDRGYYEGFGGAYLPEILIATFDELVETFQKAKNDPEFWKEYVDIMSTYSCRPTPITFAENLTRHFGGARLYVKREDLNHTGAHKANNVMGQGLLVKRMGKSRVIAETGAGQQEWPLPPWRHGLDLNVPSTWAKWMSGGSAPMFSGWSDWVQTWSPCGKEPGS